MITTAFQIALSIVIVGAPALFMLAWGINILPPRLREPAIHQHFNQHFTSNPAADAPTTESPPTE